MCFCSFENVVASYTIPWLLRVVLIAWFQLISRLSTVHFIFRFRWLIKWLQCWVPLFTRWRISYNALSCITLLISSYQYHDGGMACMRAYAWYSPSTIFSTQSLASSGVSACKTSTQLVKMRRNVVGSFVSSYSTSSMLVSGKLRFTLT